MKKLLILGALLLVLSMHAQAQASSCAPGDRFSSETGLPCHSGPCAPGDLYSSQTGKPCSITTSQSTIMQNPLNTATPNTQPVLPKITNQLIPNNQKQVFSIKTNVPTTVTVEYADFSAIPGLGDLPAIVLNTINPMFAQYINNGSNILSYTDSDLTTDHEIPYSSLNLIANDWYATKVTVTDGDGNSDTFSGYQNAGDTEGKLNSWNIDSQLSTNKNI